MELGLPCWAGILPVLPIPQADALLAPGARPWQDTEFPNLTFALDALHSAFLPNASPLEPREWCAGIPHWHNPTIVKPGDGLPWTLTVNGGQRILDLNLLRLDTIGHLILLERFLTGRPIRGMRVLPK